VTGLDVLRVCWQHRMPAYSVACKLMTCLLALAVVLAVASFLVTGQGVLADIFPPHVSGHFGTLAVSSRLQCWDFCSPGGAVRHQICSSDPVVRHANADCGVRWRTHICCPCVVPNCVLCRSVGQLRACSTSHCLSAPSVSGPVSNLVRINCCCYATSPACAPGNTHNKNMCLPLGNAGKLCHSCHAVCAKPQLCRMIWAMPKSTPV
jgi:hypothetical protein